MVLTLKSGDHELATVQTTEIKKGGVMSGSIARPISPLPKSKMNLTRRGFLRTGAVGITALGAAAHSVSASDLSLTRRRSASLRPQIRVRGEADPTLLALVNRVSFGYSDALYQEAESLGYDAFLEQQLDPDSIIDTDWENRLAGLAYGTLTMSSKQIYDTYVQIDQILPLVELIGATTHRAIYSRKQLYERMVEFWSDHFNVYILDGHCQWLKTADDRDVIRSYAMTTVPQLLNASARSAAMLYYLDNYANIVGLAQENYARELLELHSMGVGGGYTQADVEEVARCLTGWTFHGPASPDYGTYVYYAPYHDTGPKTVLGTSIPARPAADGWMDGQDVLDIISMHPSTARFIAHKLCVRFLGYDPPEDVVESVKETYLSTGGDIKSMLRVILHQNVQTYLSTPKFKRPFHLTASLLRATDADILEPRFLEFPLLQMGQIPFFWEPPNGYPDSLAAWGASLLHRWEYGSTAFFFTNFVGTDLSALLANAGGTVGNEGEAINLILTGGTMTSEEVAEIQQFYDDYRGSPVVNADAFGLGASMASYQWY